MGGDSGYAYDMARERYEHEEWDKNDPIVEPIYSSIGPKGLYFYLSLETRQPLTGHFDRRSILRDRDQGIVAWFPAERFK